MLSAFIIGNYETTNALSEYCDHLSLNLIGVSDLLSESTDIIKRHKPDVLFLELSLLTADLKSDQLFSLCFVVIIGDAEADAFLAFERQAFDYMVNPVSYSRFSISVDKVKRVTFRILNVLEQKRDAFFIRIDDKGIKEMMIRYADLVYVEAMQNYVVLHLENGSKYLSYNTMKDVEEHLPVHSFTRVHKSFIINESKINAIDGNGVFLNTMDNKKILIGNKYRKAFNEKRADRVIRSHRFKLKDAYVLILTFVNCSDSFVMQIDALIIYFS